jgi:hypothetical protein
MADREPARRSRAVLKGFAGLVGIVSGLAAVAYAALGEPTHPTAGNGVGPPAGGHRLNAPGAPHKAGSRPIPAPEITRHPNRVETSASARFGFTDGRGDLRFQCRLDRRGWRSCRSPIVLKGLGAGSHKFSVRALDARRRRSPAARFRWRLLAPKAFSIQPQLSQLDTLYPGAPPVALPLTIANPNPVPIFVTSLRATATADPQGCTSAENLALIEASVSNSAPLEVPAGGSVSLPAIGVAPPAIQLRDLPVSQDACQNAQFPLAFSGKARG